MKAGRAHDTASSARWSFFPTDSLRRDLLIRHQATHKANKLDGRKAFERSGERAIKACDSCVRSKLKCGNTTLVVFFLSRKWHQKAVLAKHFLRRRAAMQALRETEHPLHERFLESDRICHHHRQCEHRQHAIFRGRHWRGELDSTRERTYSASSRIRQSLPRPRSPYGRFESELGLP